MSRSISTTYEGEATGSRREELNTPSATHKVAILTLKYAGLSHLTLSEFSN